MNSSEKARKEGRDGYKERPWLVEIPNPYDQDIAPVEYEEFEKGWDYAEFLAKIDAGYFDWI